MSGKSLDDIFIQPRFKLENIDYWRGKIKKSVDSYNSQKRSRNQSLDFAYNPKQLNVMLNFLRSEQKKLKNELKNQENLLNIYKTYDYDEENSTKHSEDSTPTTKKSLKQENPHLITFRPGERWTDCQKPKKNYFPREVFTVPKSYLSNIY